MAATYRSAIIRDARKERREDKWAVFFSDDNTQVEETWEASVEALLGNREVPEEPAD
jgi:hypothetical protein